MGQKEKNLTSYLTELLDGKRFEDDLANEEGECSICRECCRGEELCGRIQIPEEHSVVMRH